MDMTQPEVKLSFNAYLLILNFDCINCEADLGLTEPRLIRRPTRRRLFEKLILMNHDRAMEVREGPGANNRAA